MSWHNTRGFDQGKATKVPGSCLVNTREGFGINGKYPNAWQAWLHTEQHHDQPPAGLDIPVFFSYIDANHGHVGVRLADGRFWSDGNLYASIADYEKKKAPRYVGWGESINGQRVVEYVPDPVPSNQVTIQINSGEWNVRTSPSLSASVIGNGKAPALGGQRYAATINANGWANIQFTGQSGWVGPKVFTKV